MNILSLFDGISCGQYALSSLNIDYTYYASEIEKSSIYITNNNFPNTIQLGDVTEVISSDIPEIDLLIGGSPCQSFSKAVSSNTGFDGKSKLFFEYIRLLNEKKPKYFLLENVTMKKEWVDIITNLIGVEPILINSELFGGQSRERLYWTNIPILPFPERDNRVLKDYLESNVNEKYFYKEEYVYHGDDKVVCATLNINGHDILKRVNSPNHKCQTLTAVCGGNQHKKTIDNGRVRKLTPVEYERLMGLPDNYTVGVSDSARYKSLGNGWSIEVIKHIFKGLTK